MAQVCRGQRAPMGSCGWGQLRESTGGSAAGGRAGAALLGAFSHPRFPSLPWQSHRRCRCAPVLLACGHPKCSRHWGLIGVGWGHKATLFMPCVPCGHCGHVADGSRCGHGERGDGRWFAPHQKSATGKEQDTKEWLEQANQLKCQRKTEAWYFLCLLSAVNRQAFLFPCLKSCHFNRLFSCRFFPCTFVNNPQTAEALLSQLIGVK